jgi:hypothetical protein
VTETAKVEAGPPTLGEKEETIELSFWGLRPPRMSANLPAQVTMSDGFLLVEFLKAAAASEFRLALRPR